MPLPDNPSDQTRALNPGLYQEDEYIVPETPAFQKLARSLFPATDALEVAMYGPFETALKRLGFESRNVKPENLTKKPRVGWFAHLARPEGNPLFLDFPVWTHDGRFVEIEFKLPGKKPTPHQAVMLRSPSAALCTTVAEAVIVVKNRLLNPFLVQKALAIEFKLAGSEPEPDPFRAGKAKDADGVPEPTSETQ